MAEDKKLEISLALFALFSGIYMGIVKILLSMKGGTDLLSNANDSIMRSALIVFSYFIFKYGVEILINIGTVTKYYFSKNSEDKKDADHSFLYIINGWKDSLKYSIIAILTSITIIYHGLAIGLIYFILMVVFIPFDGFFYFEKGKIKFPSGKKLKKIADKIIHLFNKIIDIKSHFVYVHNSLNQNIIKFLKGCLKLFFDLITIIAYYLIFISLFSYVNITTDKEFYFQGENVYVSANPSGAMPPIIKSIYYHDILLYNDTMEPNFPRSTRNVMVPGSLLKLEPYNSHINVVYRFFSNNTPFFGIFGDNAFKQIIVFQSNSSN